eukprot:12808239-Ditylum_brightwellii.AAC.1
MKWHQDDDTHYEEQDLPVQLNIDVDFLAVNYRTTKGRSRPRLRDCLSTRHNYMCHTLRSHQNIPRHYKTTLQLNPSLTICKRSMTGIVLQFNRLTGKILQ